MSEKKKPDNLMFAVKAGTIQASIWKNVHEKVEFFNVVASRSYKQGEEWKKTEVTLNMREVPDMILCLKKVYEQNRAKVQDIE